MGHLQDDEAAAQLFFDISLDIEKWRSGDEIDFQGKYEAAIRSSGAIVFLTELFRRFEGSALLACLNAVTFLWKDLAFCSWREVLLGIDDSTQAIYQFVWFAARFLGIDILSMIQMDPDVNETAKVFVRAEFPSGAPHAGGSWEREALENTGVDAVALWKRLAAEGAPMKVDFAGLQ